MNEPIQAMPSQAQLTEAVQLREKCYAFQRRWGHVSLRAFLIAMMMGETSDILKGDL